MVIPLMWMRPRASSTSTSPNPASGIFTSDPDVGVDVVVVDPGVVVVVDARVVVVAGC
jgi:hypothetical protein